MMLLNGQDEIIEPGQRAEIAQQSYTFIRQHEHAGNRFVIPNDGLNSIGWQQRRCSLINSWLYSAIKGKKT
ncbi:MAG: hypothetical protein AAF639_36690 [Chloroflexota bacterium]